MFNLLWLNYYVGTIFDGMGRLVLHYGIAAIIILGCFAWAYFVPVGKKLALYIALATGVALAAFTLGVKDENNRWAAQELNISKIAEKAHTDAVKRVTHPSRWVRHDQYNRDDKR